MESNELIRLGECIQELLLERGVIRNMSITPLELFFFLNEYINYLEENIEPEECCNTCGQRFKKGQLKVQYEERGYYTMMLAKHTEGDCHG